MRACVRPSLPQEAAPLDARFAADLLDGLRRTHKRIPCKYLYDERGSELFERICALPEYYLTRTELAIMDRHAGEMAGALGPRCLVVEFGSGSGRKTALLLDHLKEPAAYVPIDIAGEALARAARRIAAAHPGLEVRPVRADYTDPVDLPRPRATFARRAVYFPGSTIGNFTLPEARRFLGRVAALVGPGGAALVGADLRKDPRVLEAAYDDARGITAAFNLNLLERANRELGADFSTDRFRHAARYDRRRGRIEMHLVSRQAQRVRLPGATIPLARGESILTEYSYKYTLEGLARLAAGAGMTMRRAWTDARAWFAVVYLEARPARRRAPGATREAASGRQREVSVAADAHPQPRVPRLATQRPRRQGGLTRPVH